MDNIKTFDLYAGAIFDLLYRSFPVPVKFDYTMLLADKNGDIAQEIDASIMYFTISWLEDNGFIKCDLGIFSPKTNTEVSSAILTHKGLALLKTPQSIKHKGETIGQSIINAMKSGAKSSVEAATNSALSTGASMIARLF